MPDRNERALLTGLAQLLDVAGVGAYKPTGGYTLDDTAIVFGELPSDPPRVIALTLYAATDAITENLTTRRLQVMMRSAANDSLDVGDLADDVFLALHGLEHVDLDPVHVVQSNRVSSVPLGMDSSRRYLRSDNYELDVNTPGRP